MAGYKDDLQAAHARIAALEREVAELRGDRPRDSAASAAAKPYHPPRPIGSAPCIFLATLPFLLAIGYLRPYPQIWIALGFAAVAELVLLIALQAFVELVRPWELLVLSGASARGHRTFFSGRTLRIPLVQAADRLDLRVQCVDWKVSRALTRSGTPIQVSGYALVAVSDDPALCSRAAERFLGRHVEEIAATARQLAQEHLGRVVARLSPEELDADRLTLARSLSEELSPELARLGLTLFGAGILEVNAEEAD